MGDHLGRPGAVGIKQNKTKNSLISTTLVTPDTDLSFLVVSSMNQEPARSPFQEHIAITEELGICSLNIEIRLHAGYDIKGYR